MSRTVRHLVLAGTLLYAATAFAESELLLPILALDPEGVAVPGVRFTYDGVESLETTDAGVTELRVPLAVGHEIPPGTAIELGLPAALGRTWFLIDDTVHVPAPHEPPAEVVVMTRAAFRRLAAEVRDEPPDPQRELTKEERREVVAEYAAGYGLDEAELENAIAAFQESAQDPMDEGVAAYMAQEWARAEPFFRKALADAEKRQKEAEDDVADAAFYLGRTLYEQGHSRAAADAFRKALTVHKNNTTLMNWLGGVLRELANWEEAEKWIRLALLIDEKSLGRDNPKVAIRLKNLTHLLYETNRLEEAEQLMHRTLAIDEASLGHNNPEVATDLNNLARLLMDTNRLEEAESLIRRALEIDELSFGTKHPNVARDLNNLAQLLQVADRLAEAESLLRRALTIDEAVLGKEHPEVARLLSNRAQLLQTMNRFGEAEPLLRRSLENGEIFYGPDHPNVAIRLNNLALLLQATDRFEEAEPLMRHALSIAETSFGNKHPRVATALNNLALLLQDTNRLAEAEPLARRAVAIFKASLVPSHPHIAAAVSNHAAILRELGRHDEADAIDP